FPGICGCHQREPSSSCVPIGSANRMTPGADVIGRSYLSCRKLSLMASYAGKRWEIKSHGIGYASEQVEEEEGVACPSLPCSGRHGDSQGQGLKEKPVSIDSQECWQGRYQEEWGGTFSFVFKAAGAKRNHKL
ncbi:Uncharacterized protein DAT39_018386, partial [Clarias magur]